MPTSHAGCRLNIRAKLCRITRAAVSCFISMFCETTTKGSSWTPRTTLKITFHLRIRTLALTPSRTLNTLNLLSRREARTSREPGCWLRVQQGFLREERLAQAKERDCAPSQGRSLRPIPAGTQGSARHLCPKRAPLKCRIADCRHHRFGHHCRSFLFPLDLDVHQLGRCDSLNSESARFTNGSCKVAGSRDVPAAEPSSARLIS